MYFISDDIQLGCIEVELEWSYELLYNHSVLTDDPLLMVRQLFLINSEGIISMLQ